MSTKRSIAVLAVLALASPAPGLAESTARTIDFNGFLKISKKVRRARVARRVPIERFLAIAESPGAIVLDTRSREAYEGKHLAGAVHLNFSDMTEESLARVIGDRSRPVLIYCNNNFRGDPKSFALKVAPAALNIPTFVTLWTYGYRNVYELADLLEVTDPRLAFEGELVEGDRGRSFRISSEALTSLVGASHGTLRP